MQDSMHTHERRDRGAVMVEFALILPLLLLLVMGIIWFGFALNAKISIQSAAREGVRAAAVGDDGVAAASASLGDPPFLEDLDIDVPACAAGGSVTATVTASFHLDLPFIPTIEVPLEAIAKMRCEV